MAFFGLLIGLFLSITFVILQKKLGFIMITTELAYPVEFRIINVIIVFITILILGFLAARIASSRISNKILR